MSITDTIASSSDHTPARWLDLPHVSLFPSCLALLLPARSFLPIHIHRLPSLLSIHPYAFSSILLVLCIHHSLTRLSPVPPYLFCLNFPFFKFFLSSAFSDSIQLLPQCIRFHFHLLPCLLLPHQFLPAHIFTSSTSSLPNIAPM